MPLPMTTSEAAKTGTGIGAIATAVLGTISVDQILDFIKSTTHAQVDDKNVVVAAAATLLAWAWHVIRARRAVGK